MAIFEPTLKEGMAWKTWNNAAEQARGLAEAVADLRVHTDVGRDGRADAGLRGNGGGEAGIGHRVHIVTGQRRRYSSRGVGLDRDIEQMVRGNVGGAAMTRDHVLVGVIRLDAQTRRGANLALDL